MSKEIFEIDLRGSHGSSIKAIPSIFRSSKSASAISSSSATGLYTMGLSSIISF